MPGAYAHISIVNAAQKRTAGAGLRRQTSFSLSRNLKYLELGAVSPDYPYLAFGQAKWADNMHYSNTSILLRSGVGAVRNLPEDKRARATAWLCGFAAHMAADMTIHPVVEIKVGPYKDNKRASSMRDASGCLYLPQNRACGRHRPFTTFNYRYRGL